MKLLTTQNPKTLKGEAKGWLTAIMHLAPANTSGRNVCPHSTPGCRAVCLDTAGRGAWEGVKNPVHRARIERTRMFFRDRTGFMLQLRNEIALHARRARRRGLKPCVRLNGTSDIAWERVTSDGYTLMQHFRDVMFYDYTKWPLSMRMLGMWQPNYYIVASRSEQVPRPDETGTNFVVVFSTKKGKPLPKHYLGRRVVDGDLSDLRFLDPKGVVVGVRAKGKARRDKSGFVVQV